MRNGARRVLYEIQHITTTDEAGLAGLFGLCDVIRTTAPNGASILYGLVPSDEETGEVTLFVWSEQSGGGLTLLQTVSAAAGPAGGVPINLTFVPKAQAGGAQDLLLVTGVAGATIWAQSATANGTVQAHVLDVSDALPNDLNLVTTVTVAGSTFAYGARMGNDRPAIYRVEDNGDWTQISGAAHWTPSDGIEPVTITGFGVVPEEHTSGRPILVAALEGEDILVTYRVGSGGFLTEWDRVEAAEGWGIANPTALEVVTIGGQAFAVVGAAGSSTISVVQIANDGIMTLTDHVMDTRDTRFDGVDVLSTIVDGDVAYVAVAGGDQGVSVFQLLSDGTLNHVATVEDTLVSVADDVAAILLSIDAGELIVQTLSGSEDGMSTYAISIGSHGGVYEADDTGSNLAGGQGNDVLFGGAGDDVLWGNGGDDVLRDGAGTDTLYGGEGQDRFVMSSDGVRDVIFGFDPDEDTIDLSHWPFLRTIAQLTFTTHADGAEIQFGDEVLRIFSEDGQALTDADLFVLDLIQDSRILPSWFETFAIDPDPAPVPDPFPEPDPVPDPVPDPDPDPDPAPAPSPDLIDPTISATDNDDVVSGTDNADTIYGMAGDDRISAGDAGDRVFGGSGNDSISGRGGGDTLSGEADDDRMFGNAGSDTLFGGSENDSLYGGTNGDVLYGEAGLDGLWGGSGADILFGGSGDDMLFGQAGADQLRGEADNDFLDGGINFDELFGGEGNDTLSGMNGFDSLFGEDGDDFLFGNAGNDQLFGGFGNDDMSGGIGADSLFGGNGGDTLSGNSGSDVLDGGGGVDLIYGNAGNDVLSGGAGSDTLFGGQGADSFIFTAGDDVINDFSNNIDMLAFDAALWGGAMLSPEQVLEHATLVDGSVVFDFGDGNSLTLEGVENLSVLIDDIDVF